MKRFAIVENNVIANIAAAESAEILLALLPKAEIIEETNETGIAWVGADVINKKFKAPQLFESWTYDAETNTWLPPIPQPQTPSFWDESTLTWVELTSPEPEVTDGSN